MKKLLSLLCITLALTFSTPSAHAAGGCFMYWRCHTTFFLLGGSVYVQHPDGSGYTVDFSNYNAQAQYGLQNGSRVYAFRSAQHSDCSFAVWGSSIFCVCNHAGGVDCSPGGGTLAIFNGDLYDVFQAYISCDCPNGSSYGGVSLITTAHCQ